ncbi:nuclease harbi1 [Lasius niger]|uniref:Nuclease harbi1 n=1 Tax=Lasius niger TaxID=67767 RepID=A0A0J7K4L4_LASNI|nr:nuclease harbi1 [Lasius niger]
MFPETFEVVLQLIGPGLRAVNNASAGRKTISEEKQLCIVIWFMATPDSYSDNKSLDVDFKVDAVGTGGSGPSLEASERGFVEAFLPKVESITG